MILFVIGFSMLLNPLVVIADFVPFIGSLVSGGVFLISLVISLFLSFLTISIAWIFYRPIVAIPLLVIALAAGGFVAWKMFSKKPAPAAA